MREVRKPRRNGNRIVRPPVKALAVPPLIGSKLCAKTGRDHDRFTAGRFSHVYNFGQTCPPLRYDRRMGLRPRTDVKCSCLTNAQRVPNRN
jgi:hypothetical protein